MFYCEDCKVVCFNTNTNHRHHNIINYGVLCYESTQLFISKYFKEVENESNHSWELNINKLTASDLIELTEMLKVEHELSKREL